MEVEIEAVSKWTIERKPASSHYERIALSPPKGGDDSADKLVTI